MSSIGLSFGESLADERPRSLTSAVQERLRADILSTRLLPGQKLHIAGLAKQFSVSLAAVREALSRLVADGLVQASDQRGFRVSPVSPADLRDVTQTRVDIEGLALRRSIERGNAAENPHPLKAEGAAPRSRLGERWLEVEFEVCGAGDGVEAVRWGGLEAEGFVEGLGGLHGGESVEEHSFVTEGFRFCDQDDGELAADA